MKAHCIHSTVLQDLSKGYCAIESSSHINKENSGSQHNCNGMIIFVYGKFSLTIWFNTVTVACRWQKLRQNVVGKMFRWFDYNSPYQIKVLYSILATIGTFESLLYFTDQNGMFGNCLWHARIVRHAHLLPFVISTWQFRKSQPVLLILYKLIIHYCINLLCSTV